MRKHIMPRLLVIVSITVSGVMLSVQNVSAKDAQIKVVSDNKSVSRSAANNSDTVINIEVVPDKEESVSKASRSGSVAGISYDKLVMANVDEAVNVRDSASEDGKLIGKFYKECAGTIIEKGNGWTKLKTGELTGWVKNDYLLFGEEAAKLADKVVEKTATSTADCLRVREEADADGAVLDLLAKGDQIAVLEENGEWIKVEFSDGEEGYVSSEYVEIADSLGTGETIEAIQAKEAALKKAQEEATSKDKNDKNGKNGDSASSGNKEPEKTITNAVAANCSDQVLLAALIQAEAGTQPYEGQVAVGNVVVNRLVSGRYGNSLYSVIYAKGQFGPAGSGLVAKYIAQGPKASCMQAAADALAGVNYVGGATHFRNVNSGYTGIVIGAHVFW